MAEEKKTVTPKLKPELEETVKAGLLLRREIKSRTPYFRRDEWFRYKELSRTGWRRPRGIHNKKRRHFIYRVPVVSIGYGSPVVVRGLHPSGFEEVLVWNVADLDRIDPKKQAARVGGSVGARKREGIEKEAGKRSIRVLNPMRQGGADE